MTIQAPNKLKSLATLLALGGGVILLAGLAYLFLTPKTYRASARIKVIDWVHSRDLDQPSDLRQIPAECELIRSNPLLDQVILNLGLTDQWARRYHPGSPANAEETRARLLTQALIHPVPNSSLIEILVTSDDREETAKIANELARVYTSYRQAQREELISSKLVGLKQQWEAEAKKIREAQAVLDDLYFQIAKTRATNQVQFYDADAYDQLLAKRIQLEGQYVARSNELARLAKMKPEELVQVLPSVDENSPLTAPLLQLTKAKTDLLKASLDHPADSSEVKGATYVVDTLEKKSMRWRFRPSR